MKAQTFLSFVQNEYDFTRADAIMRETNLKNCWKQWFTCELVHMCSQSTSELDTEIDVHYPVQDKPAAKKPVKKKSDCEDQDGTKNDEKKVGGKPAYLSYHPTKGVEEVSEKRSASRCDFALTANGQQHFFEIRCANSEQFVKHKELEKFEADIKRIEALKVANPELKMTALFAFYGAFSSKEVKDFAVMDNSTRTTYVLDSALKGSTSIARLIQMARNGEPRLCLAAFSV